MTEVELAAKIKDDGFAFARAAQTRAWLEGAGGLGDWREFVASWDDLRRDEYMADGGRDRLRRHAVLTWDRGAPPRLEPRRPHFQSKDYNPLNGGVERWYEPIRGEIVLGKSMSATLGFCGSLFARLRSSASWTVELHQFRIEARDGAPGRPTPEGVHRDGVDCVLAMLVRRENAASGTTTVHDAAGRALGSFTLAEPLDAAFVDDARVFHGVTPIVPIDPSKPAFRDVLVATFRRVL